MRPQHYATQGPTTMTLCKCAYTGPLETPEHRRHHREWERATSNTGTVTTEATQREITDIYITLDQIIAHLHGGPLPELTPGAQGWLTRG